MIFIYIKLYTILYIILYIYIYIEYIVLYRKYSAIVIHIRKYDNVEIYAQNVQICKNMEIQGNEECRKFKYKAELANGAEFGCGMKFD